MHYVKLYGSGILLANLGHLTNNSAHTMKTILQKNPTSASQTFCFDFGGFFLVRWNKYGTSLIIYLSFKKYNFIIFEINILCWLYLSFWLKWMDNFISSDLLTKKETKQRENFALVSQLYRQTKYHG